ncbi:hypothetical protein LXA43DRAFT_1161139 [Ganoderma leucocontextum]|nr:hypothetical protein LXA43DRAFT_1161139 [Ganoderma leucocontextum]
MLHDVRDSLYLAFTTAVPADGPDVNLSARQLTHDVAAIRWRGNLIGFRARDPDGPHAGYLPATMDDLPATWSTTPPRPPPTSGSTRDATMTRRRTDRQRARSRTSSRTTWARGYFPASCRTSASRWTASRFSTDAGHVPAPPERNDQQGSGWWRVRAEPCVVGGHGPRNGSGNHRAPRSGEEQENLNTPDEPLRPAVRELVGIIKDTDRREAIEALMETAFRLSSQGLAAQKEAFESCGRAGWYGEGGRTSLKAMICVAIIFVFLVVMAGGASWCFGFQYGRNGIILTLLKRWLGGRGRS